MSINGADVHLRWVKEGAAGADHDVGHRPEKPPQRRRAGRPRDALRRRQPDVGALGDGSRAGGRGGGGCDPAGIRFSVLTAMWVGDDQEEAWAKCRWAPAACANHIEDTMKRNPEHGMPDTMTRLVQARDDYDYYAGHLDSAAEHTEYLGGDLVDDCPGGHARQGA